MFFLRIRARRGKQIAAVATARKLAVLCWHLLAKQEDYAWRRPALHAKKRRDLALKTGFPSHKGGNQRGTAYAYNLESVREQERRWIGAGRESLSPLRHRLATQGAKAAHGRRKEARLLFRPRGGTSSLHPALRHAVARAQSSYPTTAKRTCRFQLSFALQARRHEI